MSAIGLLDKLRHNGGIYQGELAGNIIEELLLGFTYTIEDDVKIVPIYGWLPVGTRRENLHQVLFAIGASITKKNGDIHIKFLKPTENPMLIEDERIYLGGSVEYPTRSTQINVSEHGYYALDTDEIATLFDNTDGTTAAEFQEVRFDNPYHSFEASGITIDEIGVNYAIVTGTGILTGKEFTHTQKL